MGVGELLLFTGALLAAALGASLAAGRLRVPALVLLLGLGMAIGSDGTGWIDFDDYDLARSVGVVALALILFEGGLTAGFPEIRPVLGPAVSLAVVGTVVTAIVVGLAASALLGLGTLEGLLLGAILSSTDGAAVFAVLRDSTLRRRLARTLEGEAGFNDPVAVLMVVALIEAIRNPEFGPVQAAGLLGMQLAVGLVVGVAVGALGVAAVRRVKLASAGLYPVASIAVAALSFGLADVMHGSGFLAVYLAGLVLGSRDVPAQRTMATFHEGMAWVAQLILFLALGLLVFPAQLLPVALPGTLIALVVVFLARPLGAWLATLPWSFTAGERLILGWAGLRGAVPVVLATFPVIADVPGSLEFFNIVFFAVLLSTVMQGTTIEALAARLGVTSNEAAVPQPLLATGAIRRLGAEVVEHPVAAGDAAVGARVRELGLPRDALLNLIVRGDRALPPRGSTTIRAGDRLHIIVRQEAAIELGELRTRWREGPLERPRRPRGVPRGSTLFTARPWRPEEGDASRPTTVDGVEVVERLRTRRDQPGAVVGLADGRFAVTGRSTAVGSARQLTGYARRRLAGAGDEDESGWWREVIGALASP